MYFNNKSFDTMVPVFMVLPDYLSTHGYQPIKDIMDTPFQLGHKTKLDPWAWGQEKPKRYQNFLEWMTHAREGDPIFLDAVDLAEYFQKSDKDTVLFVDVSGSRGLMTVAVRNKYAQVPGRVILQDQDYTIATAKKEPIPGFHNIETHIHDFFAGPNPLTSKSSESRSR
jgi:demethylsterigmatocystin 6-O-methyltransferase